MAEPSHRPRAFAIAALSWGAAEASLFFVVPDVIIGYVALKRGARAGLVAAALAALGAIVGGAGLYLWSAQSPRALAAVEAVPAVSPAMVTAARTDIARDGWLSAAIRGPLTSTPYKVYAVLAPQAGARLPAVAALTLPARLPRFLVAALGFAVAGHFLRRRLAPRALGLIYAAGWIVFYGWFWMSHPG